MIIVTIQQWYDSKTPQMTTEFNGSPCLWAPSDGNLAHNDQEH